MKPPTLPLSSPTCQVDIGPHTVPYDRALRPFPPKMSPFYSFSLYIVFLHCKSRPTLSHTMHPSRVYRFFRSHNSFPRTSFSFSGLVDPPEHTDFVVSVDPTNKSFDLVLKRPSLHVRHHRRHTHGMVIRTFVVINLCNSVWTGVDLKYMLINGLRWLKRSFRGNTYQKGFLCLTRKSVNIIVVVVNGGNSRTQTEKQSNFNSLFLYINLTFTRPSLRHRRLVFVVCVSVR